MASFPSSARAVYFTAAHEAAVQDEDLPAELGASEVAIKAEVSGISAGTEMLVFRGQMPQDSAEEFTIKALATATEFPIKYGYSVVGSVVAAGDDVTSVAVGDRVFVFHPHQTYFVVEADAVKRVPDNVRSEDAIFLPNMETAVNFVHDAQPMIGEQAAVFGQGVVGLLTTALLARMSLGAIVTADMFEKRRELSVAMGASASMDPTGDDFVQEALSVLSSDGTSDYRGADVTFEVSGSPYALDGAVNLTGSYGRLVIGSWYGSKRVNLDLGGRFHRSHMSLVASQVSVMGASAATRWTKERRFGYVWRLLAEVQPSDHLITHRIPIEEAASAYQLLDTDPSQTCQVVFTYE